MTFDLFTGAFSQSLILQLIAIVSYCGWSLLQITGDNAGESLIHSYSEATEILYCTLCPTYINLIHCHTESYFALLSYFNLSYIALLYLIFT